MRTEDGSGGRIYSRGGEGGEDGWPACCVWRTGLQCSLGRRAKESRESFLEEEAYSSRHFLGSQMSKGESIQDTANSIHALYARTCSHTRTAVYTHTHNCVHMRTVHLRAHAHTRTCVHTHTCACTHMCTCTCTFTHTPAYTHTCTRTHAHTRACVHMCT